MQSAETCHQTKTSVFKQVMNCEEPLCFQGPYEGQQEVLLCQQLAEQRQRLLDICLDL